MQINLLMGRMAHHPLQHPHKGRLVAMMQGEVAILPTRSRIIAGKIQTRLLLGTITERTGHFEKWGVLYNLDRHMLHAERAITIQLDLSCLTATATYNLDRDACTLKGIC